MKYDINFNILIRWMLPPVLRNQFNLNWLKELIAPIAWLHGQFLGFKNQVDYNLGINSQVVYLEKAINDMADPIERRIEIQDTPEYLVTLIHTDEAQKPVKLFQENSGNNSKILLIHDESAYVDGSADFNVIIPFSIPAEIETRLKGILNTYKLAGKRYKILYI